jgi:hypothetical protein
VRRWSGLEEAALVGHHDRLGAVSDVQLLKKPRDMRFHGGVADEQLAADLRVRLPDAINRNTSSSRGVSVSRAWAVLVDVGG